MPIKASLGSGWSIATTPVTGHQPGACGLRLGLGQLFVRIARRSAEPVIARTLGWIDAACGAILLVVASEIAKPKIRMNLTNPERLLQSTTLTAQARFGATLREQIDFSSLGVGGLLRELRLDRVVGFTPRLGEGNFRVADLLQRMESVERQLLEMDPGLGRLLILLRYVPLGRALAMMELMVSRGREPFLEVLAKVLLDPSRIEVFRTVVSAASLPASVEKDLLHAFEHLEEREVDLAFPPLIGGLEGAMRDAARARGDRKIRRNARSVAAILFDTDYELLIGMIYSEANDGRHGVPFDRRAGCVLALVGLVVWMNDCQQRPAIPWLGQEVGRSLAEHRLVDVQRASLHSG